MKNVKGGFAYIDMGIYGEVTTASAKDTASNELEIVQGDKTIIVTGLNLKTVGTFSPFIASFTSATAAGVTTWTAPLPAVGGKIGTIAITSAGKITVTKGA